MPSVSAMRRKVELMKEVVLWCTLDWIMGSQRDDGMLFLGVSGEPVGRLKKPSPTMWWVPSRLPDSKEGR